MSPRSDHSGKMPPVPSSPLPFSASVSAGGFVFVSGQASVDATGQIVNDTFEGEMRRSIANVVAILRIRGMTLKDVVQVRSYVGRQEDLAEYNRIYRELFSSPYPARTTIIGVLGSLLKYEIDVTAYPGGPDPTPK
jgi:2-iminobutanoate/2-iminopropanoate deaminase